MCGCIRGLAAKMYPPRVAALALAAVKATAGWSMYRHVGPHERLSSPNFFLHLACSTTLFTSHAHDANAEPSMPMNGWQRERCGAVFRAPRSGGSAIRSKKHERTTDNPGPVSGTNYAQPTTQARATICAKLT